MDAVDLSAYNGAIGNEIVIQAHDDFEVISVHVSISDAGGQAIEAGAALEAPARSGRWVYMATATVAQGTEVRIAVIASDRPGGVGEAAAEKSL